MIEIRRVKPTDPEVAALIEFHLSGMISNSPKDSIYALGVSGLSSTDVTLFGAFENDKCLSIGALKSLSPTDGEIKSMRTAQAALGRGLGKAILKHIIEVAQMSGLKGLFLETGTGPTFAAAHHIYQTHGFVPYEPFGNYTQSTFNRFFWLKV